MNCVGVPGPRDTAARDAVVGARAPGAIRGRVPGHPFLVDGALAAVCAAIVLPGFLGDGVPARSAVLVTFLSAAPLTVRRSMPVPALALTTAVFLGVLLWRGEPGPGIVCCLVALYSAAVAAPRTRALIVGTVTAAVIALPALLVTGRHFFDAGNFVLIAWLAAATAIAAAARSRRAYIRAIEDRAERAERTREAEASRRVAEERLRLARELHDIVAHSITVINFQAGVAAELLRREPDAAETAIEHVITASGATLTELGTILTVLRQPDGDAQAPPPTEPLPGLDRLDDLLAGFRAAGLAIDLHRDRAHPPALSPAVSLAGYRIIQESLTNALRYATPRTATVRLSGAAHRLRITVVNPVDGGAAGGSAPPRREHWGTGRGLLGLHERAASVGGHLDVERGADRFRVEALLPTAQPDQPCRDRPAPGERSGATGSRSWSP